MLSRLTRQTNNLLSVIWCLYLKLGRYALDVNFYSSNRFTYGRGTPNVNTISCVFFGAYGTKVLRLYTRLKTLQYKNAKFSQFECHGLREKIV